MKKIALVVDCADPKGLAEFWSPALGYEKIRHHGQYTVLSRGGPGFPPLILQRVPEPKTSKNRLHLDIIEPDIEAEASRLEKLGARRLTDTLQEPVGNVVVNWIVMGDPEGNEFCVGDAGMASPPAGDSDR